MSVQLIPAAQAMQALADFSSVIDARSPGEYAEDHLPGAVNWPTLHDEERKSIGTLYKQVNAFEAKNAAQRWPRAIFPPISKPMCWTNRATGHHWPIAGAAASAVARSRWCSTKSGFGCR